MLLFGGTFDPPHNGHMNNLKAAMELVHPDRVIVMPAGIPPHKAASSTPGEIRLEMCSCFKKLGAEVEVWDWELCHAGKSFSFNTLEMLSERFKGAELYMTVGSDMLTTFTGWYRWEDILRLATIVVESRENGDDGVLREAAKPLTEIGGHILFAHAPALPLSSTDVRTGKAGRESLPPEVWEIVEKYQLYRS